MGPRDTEVLLSAPAWESSEPEGTASVLAMVWVLLAGRAVSPPGSSPFEVAHTA